MIVDRTPYNQKYIPQYEDTIQFFLWFNSMFDEENKTAPMHFQMVDHINSPGRKKGLECTRGASKSTLIGVYYLVYCLWKGSKYNHGELDTVIYIMDSVSMAEKHISRIISTIENNSAISKRLTIKKSRLGDDPQVWVYNEKTRKMIYVVGRGSGQKIRGINLMNKRPDWIILDDVENEDNVATPDARKNLRSWFLGTVIPIVNPNRYEFTFIGTPLHQASLLAMLLESSDWKFIQLPAAEKFPINKGERLISCWPDRFTLEYLNEMYETYKIAKSPALFRQEFMLEIIPTDGRLYDLDKINRYDVNEIKNNKDNYSFYVSVDLAISEKTTADYTSIAVIAIDSSGNWFLVDGFFGRIKPDVTIDKIFYYASLYRPYEVVIEKVAFQAAMETFIKREMIERGVYFSISGVRRTSSKLSVLKAFQPIVDNGSFHVPENSMKEYVDELLSEMESITEDAILAKHDDLIDSISQLTMIDIIKPSSSDIKSPLDNSSNSINPYIF